MRRSQNLEKKTQNKTAAKQDTLARDIGNMPMFLSLSCYTFSKRRSRCMYNFPPFVGREFVSFSNKRSD